MFEQNVVNYPKESQIYEGVVMSIIRNKGIAVVDVGGKSDGKVNLSELTEEQKAEIKPGDILKVYIERTENRHGEMVLSHSRAVREESWRKFETALEERAIIKGTIIGDIKGGYIVQLAGGVHAFLPGSQVDVKPVTDVSMLLGKEQSFMILKMVRDRGNIIVSRRAIMEEDILAKKEEALADISVGKILKGFVKNILDYGAFIDLGVYGDGLLHITDISWKRINHPSEAISLGDEKEFLIIKFDEKTKRISLGLKQLEDNPWNSASEKYAVGSVHKGNVVNVADYGAFVELEVGIEGLVHSSEMSWIKKSPNPSRLVRVGQEVDVQVLEIDAPKSRLSLGMKQCIENPWQKFQDQYKPGDVLEGDVKSVTDFGLFVAFDGGIEGLVRIQDILWGSTKEDALKPYEKGQRIKVKILDLDIQKERIALGIKQLSEDPYAPLFKKYPRGSVGTFEVANVVDGGIEVTVSDNVKAFIKRSDLAREKIECRPERFSIGDRVDAMVIVSDKDTGVFKLSIRSLEEQEQKKAIAEYGSADSGAKLGNIFGMALDDAKKKLEASAKSADSSSPSPSNSDTSGNNTAKDGGNSDVAEGEKTS
jgi:small subunit ribosomal protein S1